MARSEAITSYTGGTLVVPDFQNDRLQFFTPEGEVIGELTEIPGSGPIILPANVLLDQGDLYLLASVANRDTLIKLRVPSL